jgi:hypothetical protein
MVESRLRRVLTSIDREIDRTKAKANKEKEAHHSFGKLLDPLPERPDRESLKERKER